MSAPSDPPPSALEGLLDLSARLGATIVPVVVGYRSRWLAESFSPEGAEAMAVAFHDLLLAQVFSDSPTAPAEEAADA